MQSCSGGGPIRKNCGSLRSVTPTYQVLASPIAIASEDIDTNCSSSIRCQLPCCAARGNITTVIGLPRKEVYAVRGRSKTRAPVRTTKDRHRAHEPRLPCFPSEPCQSHSPPGK